MLLPGLPATHLRRTTARIDNRLFQFGGFPGRDSTRHGCAISGRPQYPLGRCAMMGRVGVQADPAIHAGVITRYRVPQRRHLPPHGANRRGEPQRGQAPIHADAGQAPGLLLNQLRDGLAGGADAGGRQVSHGEGRRQGTGLGLGQWGVR